MKCWGGGNQGQLEDGRTATFGPSGLVTHYRTTPVSVLNVSGATKMAAGNSSTCVLVKGGVVKCWGDTSSSYLPDISLGLNGLTISWPAGPQAVPWPLRGLGAVRVIAPGVTHTCAVMRTGTVKCWGIDESGSLARAAHSSDRSAPVAIPGLSRATAIAAGMNLTCAILVDKSVTCWGDGYPEGVLVRVRGVGTAN